MRIEVYKSGFFNVVLLITLLAIVIFSYGCGKTVAVSVTPPRQYQGSEIWFFTKGQAERPFTPADFQELLANQASWAEARKLISVWCVTADWLGSEENARFIKGTFLPTIKRWNMKLCLLAWQGAYWQGDKNTVGRVRDAIQSGRFWYDRIPEILGEEYNIDYISLDSPNFYGMSPPPTGAGLSLKNTLEENAKYIQHLRRLFPNSEVGIIDAFYGWSGWEDDGYLKDVQTWLAAARATPGFDIDFVDFEIPYDPEPRERPDQWVSHAQEVAMAQEWLRSQGLRTGTWFVDSTAVDWASGQDAPTLTDEAWHRERLMGMLVRPYLETGFVSDTLTVGSYGPGPKMLPESKPYTLMNVVLEVARLFGVRRKGP